MNLKKKIQLVYNLIKEAVGDKYLVVNDAKF